MNVVRNAFVPLSTFGIALCLMAMGASTEAAPGGQSGTGISATVTAAGFFTRTAAYSWSLNETVSPAGAQLTSGGSAKFTHTLTACRTPLGQVVDSDFSVQGTVCVTNGGSAATQGLQISLQVQDKVGSAPYVNLSAPQLQPLSPAEVAAGQTACYDYKLPITPVAGASYRLVATVTVGNHSGSQVTGPSPKTANFTLTTPTTDNSTDATASVTDALRANICSGFSGVSSLSSPWNIGESDLVNNCATKTFTVTVTDNLPNGDSNCSVIDDATLTTTSGASIPAGSTVTVCDVRHHVLSCLQDEEVLRAFIQGGTGASLQAGYLTQLLGLINQVRASVSTSKKPVPPLTRLVVLDAAAQLYSSQDLVGTDPTKLSHTLDGDPTSRVIAQNYDPAVVGENLAAGQWTPQEVIDAWVKSPEHYKNLIDPDFTQVGLGVAGGPTNDRSQPFVLYWVADFGSPSTGSYMTTPDAPLPTVDVRGIVAQLHADLQVVDSALCQPLGSMNDPLLTSIQTLGGDLFNQVYAQTGDFLALHSVGECLQDVLGFYALNSSSEFYAPSLNYISGILLD